MDIVKRMQYLIGQENEDAYCDMKNILKNVAFRAEWKDTIIKFDKVICIGMPDKNDKIFKEKYNWVSEQIEIFIQILLNKDYKIILIMEDRSNYGFYRNYIERFQDERVVLLTNEFTESISELLFKCKYNLNLFKEADIITYSAGKPFISICFDENHYGLLSKLRIEKLVIKGEKFNAGTLLDSVEYIKNNYKKICESIDQYFNCFKENDSDEFEGYKKQIKKIIKENIDDTDLEKAKKIIGEYEEIVENDAEIFSMKAAIAYLEGNLESAEKLIKDGLLIDGENFDLLYSMAFLSKEKGCLNEALSYFKSAQQQLKDSAYEEEILKNISELKGVDNNRT